MNSDGWRETTFQDLISAGALEIGDGYRAKNSELEGDGPLFLRSGRVSDNHIDFTGREHLPAALVPSLKGKLGLRDDTVVTTKGNSIGVTAYVSGGAPEFVYSPHLSYWRSRNASVIVPGFLRYWARSAALKSQLKAMAGSTDMAPYLSLADQRRLRIELPPRSDQWRIAGVLGALDDKIEHNTQHNGRLERWCEAYFAIEVAAACSWTVLEDVLDTLETGGRPRGGVSEYTDGIPSIGAESIVGVGLFDYSKTKFVPREYFASMRRGVVESGDVLLYKDGGRPGEFEPHVSLVGDGFPFDVMAINEHVYRLRVRPPYSQELLYLWLRSTTATDEMRMRGTGVAVPGLNSVAARELAVPVLTAQQLNRLIAAVRPVFAAILRNARESRNLGKLRDALLTRLVSGQIRVPESYDPDDAVGTVVEQAVTG